jgi:hypothetical protein
MMHMHMATAGDDRYLSLDMLWPSYCCMALLCCRCLHRWWPRPSSDCGAYAHAPAYSALPIRLGHVNATGMLE